MKHERRIFITGGHLSPAIGCIEEIGRQQKPWHLFFVGRKFAQEGSPAPSAEYTVITGTTIPFLALTAGRLSRTFTVHTIISFLKIPIGFFQALYYVVKYRPDAVISFGGYVGLPVVFAGWLLRVPSITHEQTRVPGIANRILAYFVRTICLTFPDDAQLFPKEKVLVTGLPMRTGLSRPPESPSLPIIGKKPLIYIAGGSTGSKSVNELIYPILEDLVKTYEVIHQVGPSWLAGAEKLQAVIHSGKDSYHPVSYISAADLAWVYAHAALYVGRAGANTVAELLLFDIPSIFIPLPWAGGNEQMENARFMATEKLGRILPQQGASSAALRFTIDEMIREYGMKKRARVSPESVRQGAERLVTEAARILATS